MSHEYARNLSFEDVDIDLIVLSAEQLDSAVCGTKETEFFADRFKSFGGGERRHSIQRITGLCGILGERLMKPRRPLETIEILRQCLEEAPSNVSVLIGLGVALEESVNVLEPNSLYLKAIQVVGLDEILNSAKDRRTFPQLTCYTIFQPRYAIN